MDRYIPVVREFAARVVLFHQAVGDSVGLHVTDVKVLRILGGGPMTAGQIVEHTGLTGAAVTALVDRLVAAGYVTRERDEEDRRRVTVRVVPAKVRQLDRVYEAYSAEMSKVLAQYDAREYALIESFLVKTANLLGEHTKKLRVRAAGA